MSGKSQRSDSQGDITHYTPVSKRSDSIGNQAKDLKSANIEENIKRQLKEIEERTVRASTRGKDVKCFDEKRLTLFIKALRDLADTGLISNTLMVLIRDGFEDWMRRMISHEKTINQWLLNEVEKLKNSIIDQKKEIDEWKTKSKELEISKTDLENSNATMKRDIEKWQKESAKIREEKLNLMQDILQLKKSIGEYQEK